MNRALNFLILSGFIQGSRAKILWFLSLRAGQVSALGGLASQVGLQLGNDPAVAARAQLDGAWKVLVVAAGLGVQAVVERRATEPAQGTHLL